MSYAINPAGDGWRAVNSKADLLPGETYSDAVPVLLVQAQAAQIDTLKAAYVAAVNAPVTFKNAAGVTSTYPSGNTVLANGMTAQQMLSTILAAGSSAWTLGKWLDSNSVAQTFTFADLEGLAAAMEATGTASWSDLVTKIAEVQAITESTPNAIAAVQAITW